MIKVYIKLDKKLAVFNIDTDDHVEAIAAVKAEYPKTNPLALYVSIPEKAVA